MKINKEKLLPIILFIATVIYLLPINFMGIGPYNEAVILVGAERVLGGQVPYKDFFTIYPPGQIYTLAAIFKIFGTSVVIERIYDILIKSFLSLFIFLIIRMLSSNKMALIGWGMSLIWIGHSRFAAYPVYPSILFAYVSIYFLMLHMKQQKKYYIILSAVSVVAAILFRHDLGGYAAIVISIILLIRRITGTQLSWRPLISFIAYAAAAGLPAIIYFSLNSDITLMLNELILFPANVFPKHLALPYPPLSRYNLSFYVFPAVLVSGVVTSLILMKRKTDHAAAYGIMLIALTGILLLNQARVRSDSIHLLPVALTGIMLAPVILHTLAREVSLNKWQNKAVYVLFVIVFAVTLSKPVNDLKRILSHSNGYVVEVLNPDIERAKYVPILPDLKNAAVYVKNVTMENEHIYVGVKNHDKVIFNLPIIYFLSGRNCATKYHEFNSGLINTLPVQEEIVEELKGRAVRLIVLTPGWRYEPNASNIDTEIDLLDNYILANYELKKKFGIYEIWMKKI